MMRVGVYAGALLMACTTAIVVAQTKVTTPEEFDKAMKPAGGAMRNVGKMVASGAAVADVKKEIAVLKTALADTQSFWVLHKKDDAPTTRDCPHCLMAIPVKASRCGHCTQPVGVAA